MSEEEEQLPVVTPPFLPSHVSRKKQYTLVLDLDETLIHYFEFPQASSGSNGNQQ